MPSRNRDTLKYFFSDGALPSSDMFGDLIDSMLNMDDEGFSKSSQNGFELTNQGDSENLLSFYNQSSPDEALWRVRFEGNENNLVFSRVKDQQNEQMSREDAEKAKYLLHLNMSEHQPKVGIGVAQPRDTLHVAGNVRCEGRRGVASSDHPLPLADGAWYTIGGPYTGCQTLEVVARAKNDKKRRYASMHAIAMHTISPVKRNIFSFLGLKNKIKTTHAFYDSLLHRLKLRWQPAKERGQYVLQIRTNCDYADEGVIDYHITNLWSDQQSDREDNIQHNNALKLQKK